MMGTDAELSPAENVALIQLMEQETLKLAKSRGFIGVFTTNTNELTRVSSLQSSNSTRQDQLLRHLQKSIPDVDSFVRLVQEYLVISKIIESLLRDFFRQNMKSKLEKTVLKILSLIEPNWLRYPSVRN